MPEDLSAMTTYGYITKEIKSKIVKKEDVKKEVKIEAIAEREKRRIP